MKRLIDQTSDRDELTEINNMFVYVYPLTSFHGLLYMIVNRADSVPRWRGLNHFSNYLNVEFSDGLKREDMSKVCQRMRYQHALLIDILVNLP